jgi:hypothetical protein
VYFPRLALTQTSLAVLIAPETFGETSFLQFDDTQSSSVSLIAEEDVSLYFIEGMAVEIFSY